MAWRPSPLTSEDADLADGSERRLDPQSVTVERIGGAIGSAILALCCLVGIVVAAIVRPLGILGLAGSLMAWLAMSALLAAHAWFWPARRYRSTSYRVSEQGVEIRRGVWWRSVHSVPRSRVQHTDVSQGPIERSFGLATLVIYTAGTEHAAVSLSGLAGATAAQIRDHLIQGGAGDAV